MIANAPFYVAEPPASYLSFPPIVVDCSILVAILFDEPQADAARQLTSRRTLHAPWLLDHEMASVADKKRKAGAAPELLQVAVATYLALGVTLHRASPDVVLPLALSYSISSYDAAYLAVAATLHVPLVTFDHKLGKAALRHLGSLE